MPSNHSGTSEAFRRRGAAAHKAHRAVNEAFRDGLRDRDPDAYQALLNTFFDACTKVFPEIEDAIRICQQGRKGPLVERAICWLEADPWYFRSGYLKARLAMAMRYAALDEEQKERLRKFILRIVDNYSRQEKRAYCRLAIRLRTPQFEDELEKRLDSPDAKVRYRALEVFERLNSVPE